ncbi:hypothetical protein P5673_021061 [Acropora cervicornis]|uniref:Uncharacterized protein n=1 Tax=Acropora cervicornis TaxID=6130 RepID=A0AAD9V108_ACRCE|nr:hypothetical protein P5673_021061 [Acropora cervicornis]
MASSSLKRPIFSLYHSKDYLSCLTSYAYCDVKEFLNLLLVNFNSFVRHLGTSTLSGSRDLER